MTRTSDRPAVLRRPSTRRRAVTFVLAATAGVTLPSATAVQATSGWTAPVEGRLTVVAPFAPGAANWDPGHRGVDLAAGVGDPIRAARDGVVVYAGDLAGRSVVSIDHGGLRTTYEPVDALVTAGDHVSAGEVIGRLSATGGHCRCVHWGLKRGKVYFDPLALLRRVVLKPL